MHQTLVQKRSEQDQGVFNLEGFMEVSESLARPDQGVFSLEGLGTRSPWQTCGHVPLFLGDPSSLLQWPHSPRTSHVLALFKTKLT